MKSKSENIRLFEEARTLKDILRANLHSKAINAQQKTFDKTKIIQVNMHDAENKHGSSNGK